MTPETIARIAELDRRIARERGYRERAWRIVDRILPTVPLAHGFYEPELFVARSRRNSERKRLFYRTFARLRAKAEGGRPFIGIPKHSEHLYGPGDAMWDVARELEEAA